MSNPFAETKGGAKRAEKLGRIGFGIATYMIIAFAITIFGIITYQGLPTLFNSDGFNSEFLTESPQTLIVLKEGDGTVHKVSFSNIEKWKADNPEIQIEEEKRFSYAGGGIAGPLIGTALLVIICMLISLVVGISAAIFLSEYARPGNFLNTIRLAILNLAGVPSIVFGLFGFGFFCLSRWLPVLRYDRDFTQAEQDAVIGFFRIPFMDHGYVSFEGWGTSLIAGAITLAIMVLPIIITACEESLRAVPKGFREASLALGASKWQMIRTAVLPYAFSGMLTASILGVTRVAGETAPIMFTAAAAAKATLPGAESNNGGLFWLSDLLTDSVQAMPYHIYTLAKLPESEFTKPMQQGSIFVFMVLVMSLAGLSVFLRNRIRKSLKW